MSEQSTFGAKSMEAFAATPEGQALAASLAADAPPAPPPPAPEAPPAPAPDAHAPPPPPPAPPAPAGDAPPAPAPGTPGAPAPKLRFELTVGGEQVVEEFDPAALTDPNSEDRKRLESALRRSRDYDRPGGALDHAATRRAWEALEKEGLASRGPDGRFYPTEQYARWRQSVAAGSNGNGHPPAPAAPPDPETEVRALEERFKKEPDKVTPADWISYTERRAAIAAERAAEKVREEFRQQTTAAQTRSSQDRALSRITSTLTEARQTHAASFIDPATGKPDEDLAGIAEQRFLAATRAHAPLGEDEAIRKGREAYDAFARDRGQRFEALRKVLPARPTPGQPTPPPPAAPQFGGASPPRAAAPAPTNRDRPFDPKELERAAALDPRLRA